MGRDVNPGQQSVGARAIEARAAIATAHLRSTMTSISSPVDPTSAHGARIAVAVDGLVAGMMPELEAAEALLHAHEPAQPEFTPVLPSAPSLRSAARAVGHRGIGVLY